MANRTDPEVRTWLKKLHVMAEVEIKTLQASFEKLRKQIQQTRIKAALLKELMDASKLEFAEEEKQERKEPQDVNMQNILQDKLYNFMFKRKGALHVSTILEDPDFFSFSTGVLNMFDLIELIESDNRFTFSHDREYVYLTERLPSPALISWEASVLEYLLNQKEKKTLDQIQNEAFPPGPEIRHELRAALEHLYAEAKVKKLFGVEEHQAVTFWKINKDEEQQASKA